ncbi:unnamed protein product [Ophioblennius macclurei]
MAPNATTVAPIVTTAGTTAAPPPNVVIAFVVVTPFIPALNDRNTPEFQALAAPIVNFCEFTYAGVNFFIGCIVRSFRPVAVITRTTMNNTEADLEVRFNSTAPVAEIPPAENLAEIFVEAASNPNNTGNITIDTATVRVTETNIVNTTTSAPNATTAVVNATTAAPNPTTSTTTAEAVATTSLTFTSRDETFTNDLLDSSSAAFITRSTLITTSLDPFYRQEFNAFRGSTVLSFRNGSIINTLALTFTSSSVPNNTQIANVLATAAQNITMFNIDTTSVLVNSTATEASGGVSHKISLVTASGLVLLSWLLSC